MMSHSSEKVIIHLDMDAFFAAIEQRDNPSLMGKPVVVGADPKGGTGRGVVSTCSYEARVFGIHSAMPISQAYRLCPKATFLPGDHRKYNRVSKQIFHILERYTPDIEPISIDEAFLDVTETFHLHQTPWRLARAIKTDIRDELNLAVSIGIAPVKMVAKIASDESKPDGLLQIRADEIDSFLSPLPVTRLWGIGKKSKEVFHRMGVFTIGDLKKLSSKQVHERFGENGLHWLRLASGIDPREVVSDRESKSISHEHTFEEDESDSQKVTEVLFRLAQKVSRRLRQDGIKGRCVSIKIRLKGFQTFTRARTLGTRTNFVDDINQNALDLFKDFYKAGMMIRLIGVRVSEFDDPYFSDGLFIDEKKVKKEKVHQAVDSLKDRFGDKVIHWGP